MELLYSNVYRANVHYRQQILLKKMQDHLYTDTHPILGVFKFTNAQRLFDPGTQHMIRYVFTSDLFGTLCRILAYNQFKTLSFARIITANSWHSFTELIPIIRSYQGDESLYTTAYIVPGQKGEEKYQTIINRCMWLENPLISLVHRIEKRMNERNMCRLDYDHLTNTVDDVSFAKFLGITDIIQDIQTAIIRKDILEIYNLLFEIPGIGGFLASQVCFDLLLHEATKGWKPLYKLGCGALKGAYQLGLIPNWNKATDKEAEFALKTAYQLIEPDYPYAYSNGKPVPLFIADVQNTFCEWNKFLRAYDPSVTCGNKSPGKIKKKYKPSGIKQQYICPGWMVNSTDHASLIDL